MTGDWKQQRKVAEIFGDVLPESTTDDREWPEPPAAEPDESTQDRWLKEQVPPHHG